VRVRHTLQRLVSAAVALLPAWLTPGWDVEYVEDLPDRPKRKRVYVLGTKQAPFQAVMPCPCGCGEMIWLDLETGQEEHWQILSDRPGNATLIPSIWKTDGCGSHYWLTRGRIKWC